MPDAGNKAESPHGMRECIRVFVVDDQSIIVWGLEKLVASAGQQMVVVGHAANVGDALEHLDAASPDVVVLDLDPAEEEGLHLIERLAARPKPRVLVLARFRDPALYDLAIVAGARGVVTKSEPVETILRAIERIHDGEYWLHRDAIGRVLGSLVRGAGREDTRSREAGAQKLSTLTPKELEVLQVLATNVGATAKDVANLMNISVHTVRNHCTAIYEKLGITSRLQLFMFVQQHEPVRESARSGAQRWLGHSRSQDTDHDGG